MVLNEYWLITEILSQLELRVVYIFYEIGVAIICCWLFDIAIVDLSNNNHDKRQPLFILPW